MNNYGLDSTYSSLHPIMLGDSPDNMFSTVPYEKGFQLLIYLESLIGETQMQNFLRFYITEHELTSITSVELRQTWETFIEDQFLETANEILVDVDWELWMYKGALSPEPLSFVTDNAILAKQLALGYINLQGTGSPEGYEAYNDFNSNLKVIFHTTLLDNQDQVNLSILSKIDQDYDVTQTKDPEVKQRWLPLCLGLNYNPAYDVSHDFVSTQGRIKYLQPIYQAL